jgi:hypothetical protein
MIYLKLYCLFDKKEVSENDRCLISPKCGSCDEVEDYCTQNDNDCKTCSLVNYNKDCRNNPI